MLEPLLHKLTDKGIVLASQSPRRKQLLDIIGLKFEIIPSKFEENLDKKSFAHPSAYVKETAKLKALEVAMDLKCKEMPVDLVIGADTVVVLDDQILEKPADAKHAFRMLSRSHYVFTGVALISNINGKVMDVLQFHEGTEVVMADLSNEVIEAYIKTGEPMDKAGSYPNVNENVNYAIFTYGIQGRGSTLVREIHGDYFNVMGFPLHQFSKHLLKLNLLR